MPVFRIADRKAVEELKKAGTENGDAKEPGGKQGTPPQGGRGCLFSRMSF